MAPAKNANASTTPAAAVSASTPAPPVKEATKRSRNTAANNAAAATAASASPVPTATSSNVVVADNAAAQQQQQPAAKKPRTSKKAATAADDSNAMVVDAAATSSSVSSSSASASSDAAAADVAAAVAGGGVGEAEIQIPKSNTMEHLAIATEKLSFAVCCINDAKQEVRAAFKTASKDQKLLIKLLTKKRRGTSARTGGFKSPTPIIPELAEFLGVPPTSELSRVDVSRLINQYIKTHNLRDPDNGRIIRPDTKLANLIRIQGDEVLTYFNLQRFMKHLFLKKVAVASTGTESAAAIVA